MRQRVNVQMEEKYTETLQGIISTVLSSFSLSSLPHLHLATQLLCSNSKILFRSQLCVSIRNINHIWGAGKSLAQPGRKQAWKHVRDTRDFNDIETRAVIKFFFPARQGAEGNSRHSDRNISLFPSWPS